RVPLRAAVVAAGDADDVPADDAGRGGVRAAEDLRRKPESVPRPDREVRGAPMIRRLFLGVLVLSAAGAGPAPRGSVAEWPAYGRDPGGSRYSLADQITRENVRQLKVAWTYRTGKDPKPSVVGDKAAFEATPIVVDGALYLSTPFDRVIALDPETGKERWTFDPQVS